MAEQTDLEKLTDIVTIITASIGAILGTLGFVRSLQTERKLAYRPAFAAFFEELNEKLQKHLRSAETLMRQIGESLAQTDLPDELPYIQPFNVDDYDLEYSVWRFDRGFRAILNQAVSASTQLKEAVEDYNDLRYPTSNDYATWRVIRISRSARETVEGPERIDHPQLRDEKNQEAVLKTVAPYLRRTSISISELKASAKYQRHLRKRLRAVKRALRRLDGAIASLEKRRELAESQLIGG
jgi:hypothetical protein